MTTILPGASPEADCYFTTAPAVVAEPWLEHEVRREADTLVPPCPWSVTFTEWAEGDPTEVDTEVEL